MGCDIHSYAEVRKDGKWEKVGDVFPLDDFDKEWHKKDKGDNPFDWRSYGMFGFLGNVRNYSCIPSLSNKRGVPSDMSKEVRLKYDDWDGSDGHSFSWLSLKELTDFDYSKTFWDRRVMKQDKDGCWNGAALADEGEGEVVTFKDFLGGTFFEHLDVLKSLGKPEDVRIIFWFDN